MFWPLTPQSRKFPVSEEAGHENTPAAVARRARHILGQRKGGGVRSPARAAGVAAAPHPEASSRLSNTTALAGGVGITVPDTVIENVSEVPKEPDESQARM